MYATINGVRLAYSDRGRYHDTTLLLVHAFPLNRHLWDAQLHGLANEVRVVAPDLRGFGNSEAPPGPYTMEQHAKDLAGLLDYLKIERAIVGGLSMGGYVAFEFWRRYPERVRALVLCDTRAEPDSAEGRANRDRTAQRVQEVGVEASSRELMPMMLGAASLANDRLAGRALALMCMQPVSTVVWGLQGMRDRPDSRPTLPTINVPVLALVGAEDQITPPADAEAMAAQLPDARVVVIPHAGHLSALENPRAFNAALRSFVAEFKGR